MDPDSDNYRLRSNTKIAVDCGEAIVLDVDRGKYYSLTSTATTICTGLAAGRAVNEILDELESRYGATRERLREDLLAFLAVLEARGLCEVRRK
jgi:hypothetical protein